MHLLLLRCRKSSILGWLNLRLSGDSLSFSFQFARNISVKLNLDINNLCVFIYLFIFINLFSNALGESTSTYAFKRLSKIVGFSERGLVKMIGHFLNAFFVFVVKVYQVSYAITGEEINFSFLVSRLLQMIEHC